MSYSTRVERCERCRMHAARCLCGVLRSVASPIEVVLVPQIRDWNRPSNTARLAHLVLGAEVVTVGERDHPLDPSALLHEGHRHVLLHPGGDAPPLDVRDDGRPVRLIVPDGTWRQSTRIANRFVALPGVERRAVTPRRGPRLRRPPTRDYACTAEAVAAALAVLGDAAGASALREALAQMVIAVRQTRGERLFDGSARP